MTVEEQKLKIKDFFEKYYEKNEILTILPDVPKEMLASEDDKDEEWRKWKLVPSTINDEDIEKLEKNIGVSFPNILKIFITTYFHLFDEGIGRNPIDEPFWAIENAWNPILVKAGYLPFTWDREGYFIRCIDLANMPDEDKCKICQIDHEILFDLEDVEGISRKEIEAEMVFVAENLIEYLEGILHG